MNIKIFSTTDVHGHIIPYDYLTNTTKKFSLAHAKTCYDLLSDENSIFIDNGDMIQGNFIEKFIDQEFNPAVKIMNLMNYDVWNMGNHEFNFGIKKLYSIIDQFKGHAILANSNGKFKKYTIIEKNGIKIGFIGITTVLVNEFESNILKDFKILDPIDILDNLLEKLNKECDAIIGLFHLGLGKENAVDHSGVYSIIDSLKNYKFLDIIISGHTHKGFSEIYYKDILISQAPAYANGISIINLDFENKNLSSKSAKLIELKNFNPDKEVIKAFETYHEEILKYTNKIIGYISNIKKTYNYDLEDGPLIHLMTNIMRHYYKADVVSFQIDSANINLSNGPLRRSDMANLYSYAGGEVSLYKISGSDLKKYINWSYDYYYLEDDKLKINPKRSSFKYKTLDIFGNIKYVIDYSKENKITDLKYSNGEDIKDSDKLIIGMNEYRMNFLISDKGPLKGKTYEQLASSKYILENFNTHGTIRKLAESYFESLENSEYIFDESVNFYIKY
ncbi:MAG: bifunctional metallophosphatase/5'-nucleotidase [Peptoniphilaceae bacterium]